MKKNVRLAALWVAVIFGFYSLSQAAQVCNRADMYCYESGPTGNLTMIGRLDSSGNQTVTGSLNSTLGQLGLGIPNVVQSAATPAASNTSYGPFMPAYLFGANNAVEGSVLTAFASSNGFVSVQVSSVATTGAAAVVGVAQAATTVGSIVNVYTAGSWVNALTTGTVNPGDLLITASLAPGYLVTSNTPSFSSTTIVGVAISSSPASQNGLTRVRLR